MHIQMVAFSEPKDGNEQEEWEDGAAGGVVGPLREPGCGPARARFVVADGATEAYDSQRWVRQLCSSFMSLPGASSGPRLDPAEVAAWFEEMQDQWAADAPQVFGDIIEERKFTEEGSYATLLGFEISGLDGPRPRWHAIALGDTVLFHVRAGRLLTVFPRLGPNDFGSRPDVVRTKRSALARMVDRLQADHGELAPGDILFAATDALAHWILRSLVRVDQRLVWHVLSTLVHPAVFGQLVADYRRAREQWQRMRNDDVTLVRIRILADQPAGLVVCR